MYNLTSQMQTSIKVVKDNAAGIRSTHEVRQSNISPAVTGTAVETNEIYFIRDTINGIPLPTPNFAGFGYQQFSDAQYTSLMPLTLVRNDRTQLTNNGAVTSSTMNGPFTGHSFLMGSIIRPVAVGDVILLRLTFNIMSSLMKNHLVVELDDGNILAVQDQDFARQSGEIEEISMNFLTTVTSSFLNNGARFFAMPHAQARIWDMKLLIIPMSSGAI